MTPPIAHAGHWLAGMLYLAPVFILAGGIGWQRWNDRRHPERRKARDGENHENT
jgi:hypothetical protein